MVVRTDDHGTAVVVQDGLTEAEADELCASMTAKGHKQSYEALGYRDRDERAAQLAARTVTWPEDQIAGPRMLTWGLLAVMVCGAAILMIA